MAQSDLETKYSQYKDQMNRNEWTAEILKVETSTAGDVFKESAKDPDREVIILRVKVEDGTEFNETMSAPTGPRSWKNAAFKLGQFHAKYGAFPSAGMKVSVFIDRDGFYRVTV